MERILIARLLPRFSAHSVLRMHKKGIAENILKSNQFSYGISRRVQHVILGCTFALQTNPTWVLGAFDQRNAHTDCSRGLIWQELEADTYFHSSLIKIFICMYGDKCTPQ